MIKLTNADIARLKWSLLLALALAASGLFMVRFSLGALDSATRESAQLRDERDVAMRKRLHARDEADAIRRNVATYLDLQTRGILGQERRLDWVERLNAIRDARRLPLLRYELAPQVHGNADTNGPGIMLSPMKATFGLLHEQDLLDVLDDLQTTIPAHVRTRHCHIARSTSGDAASNGALLQADCELDWMTLKVPS